MSAESVNRIERHYRRLVRLLPADERARRGEEYLGLLLDLEERRARPSAAESAAVLWLAARLQLRRLGLARLSAGLVGAVLVAMGAGALGNAIEIALSMHQIPMFVYGNLDFLALILPPVLAALAWVFGAYRTTLFFFAPMVADTLRMDFDFRAPGEGIWKFLLTFEGVRGLAWYTMICVAVPPVLLLAARRRPVRAPGWAVLASVVVGVVMEVVRESQTSDGVVGVGERHEAWVLSVACAAVTLMVARRQAWPVRLAAVTVGALVGLALSMNVPSSYALTASVIILIWEGSRLTARRRKTARGLPETAATATATGTA